MIDLCPECLCDVCVCAAIEAASALRAGWVSPLEHAVRMAEFDTEWELYREKCREAIDKQERVEVIRDPRLT